MKKLFMSICVLAAALSLQSCLHDDNEVFDTPAAQRIQQTVAEHKQLLESASNGWELHYYAGVEYSGAGYTMLIRFADGKAHVSSDMAASTKVSTSSYDVIKDMGPVLTFNTYNQIMHFLAEPNQVNVEGEQGDYEFLILEANQDYIRLKGKKWKNEMEMTRIPDGVNWKTYLDGIRAVNNKLSFIYDNKVNGTTVSTLYLSKDSRRIGLTGENQPESAYYVTSKGIHLQQPFDVGGGCIISDLEVDPVTGELKAPGQSALQIAKSADAAKNLDLTKLYGTWDVNCEVRLGTKNGGDGSAGPAKTLKVKLEDIKNELDEPYQSIIKGTIFNGDDEYRFYLYYLPEQGHLRLGENNVADPTGKLPYLEVAGLSSTGSFTSVSFTYDPATGVLTNTKTDSSVAYIFLEKDENGEEGYNLFLSFDKFNQLTNHTTN